MTINRVIRESSLSYAPFLSSSRYDEDLLEGICNELGNRRGIRFSLHTVLSFIKYEMDKDDFPFFENVSFSGCEFWADMTVEQLSCNPNINDTCRRWLIHIIENEVNEEVYVD